MYPLNNTIYIKMQEIFIQKYQRWDHTGSIQKQTSLGIEREYWKLNGYERIIREDRQNYLFGKREKSLDKPRASKKRGKTFAHKKASTIH